MKLICGLALLLLGFQNAIAYDPLPNNLHCLGNNRETIDFDNAQVMKWKTSTKNQFRARALIQGNITQIYPSKTGHAHFAINIDSEPAGDIEVIYNTEFGEIPNLKPGMVVAACGDYITVGPKAQLPSPMGAIIHWVHYNPGTRDGGKHPHGFLVINGQAFGFSAPKN